MSKTLVWIVTWLPVVNRVLAGRGPMPLPRERREFKSQKSAVDFVMGLDDRLQATAEIHLPGGAVALPVIKQMHADQISADKSEKEQCRVLEDREFAIATGVLEDCRRYIAAHKVQRWGVFKWGVTVNLALAAAAATPFLANSKSFLFLLTSGVAFASWRLVLHYNKRMTEMRDKATTIVRWLKRQGVDYNKIVGETEGNEYSAGEKYDFQELRLFFVILWTAPALILLRPYFL